MRDFALDYLGGFLLLPVGTVIKFKMIPSARISCRGFNACRNCRNSLTRKLSHAPGVIDENPRSIPPIAGCSRICSGTITSCSRWLSSLYSKPGGHKTSAGPQALEMRSASGQTLEFPESSEHRRQSNGHIPLAPRNRAFVPNMRRIDPNRPVDSCGNTANADHQDFRQKR